MHSSQSTREWNLIFVAQSLISSRTSNAMCRRRWLTHFDVVVALNSIIMIMEIPRLCNVICSRKICIWISEIFSHFFTSVRRFDLLRQFEGISPLAAASSVECERVTVNNLQQCLFSAQLDELFHDSCWKRREKLKFTFKTNCMRQTVATTTRCNCERREM